MITIAPTILAKYGERLKEGRSVSNNNNNNNNNNKISIEHEDGIDWGWSWIEWNRMH